LPVAVTASRAAYSEKNQPESSLCEIHGRLAAADSVTDAVADAVARASFHVVTATNFDDDAGAVTCRQACVCCGEGEWRRRSRSGHDAASADKLKTALQLRSLLRNAEYRHRPRQIVRRLLFEIHRPVGEVTVRLPWGHRITVDSGEVIGGAIVRLGVYDLPVTETLWRLVDPGEHVLDVGANIGAMTSVLAHRTGALGRVHAFEPHPDLARSLRRNSLQWGSVVVHEVAISDRKGTAQLTVPGYFSWNSGTAKLAPPEAGGNATLIEVPVGSLDELISADETISLAKLDIEGSELAALSGGARVISQLRDLVFEENAGYPTDVTRTLEREGFQVFAIQRAARGPRLDLPPPRATNHFDPQSLLATRDPQRALNRFADKGWRCLRNR